MAYMRNKLTKEEIKQRNRENYKKWLKKNRDWHSQMNRVNYMERALGLHDLPEDL